MTAVSITRIIHTMDIDGIKRRRPPYRNPQLFVAVRPVIAAPFIPPRAPKPQAVKTAVIEDVTVVKQTTVGVATTTTIVHDEIVSPLEFRVEEPEPVTAPEPKVAKPKDKKHKPRLLYAAAVIVVAVGGLLAYQAFMSNVAVDIQVKKLQSATASTGSNSLPTDEKPSDPNYVQTYKVAPQLPRLLTIQKIGVSARVLQVGVDANNQMGVPTTAYDVAWYNGSSRPGENGAMVIDGHVQGVGGGAVFTNLKKLAAGDIMTVERGDGKTFNYTVVKTETVPVSSIDMGALLVSADTAKPGLNLITCGGNYDQKNDQFSDRTIVYTVQQ